MSLQAKPHAAWSAAVSPLLRYGVLLMFMHYTGDKCTLRSTLDILHWQRKQLAGMLLYTVMEISESLAAARQGIGNHSLAGAMRRQV